MRGVISARSPDKEDDTPAPHTQALKPQLTIALTIIFNRDHREVESRLKLSKINLVLSEVIAALWFIPRDHGQNVDAI